MRVFVQCNTGICVKCCCCCHCLHCACARRFWATERHVCEERLAEEARAVQDLGGLQAQLAERDAALRSARARILGLRSQVLQGQEQVGRLLGLLAAGGGG